MSGFRTKHKTCVLFERLYYTGRAIEVGPALAGVEFH